MVTPFFKTCAFALANRSQIGENLAARQKAKGKSFRNARLGHFCLLPLAFCLLSLAALINFHFTPR